MRLRSRRKTRLDESATPPAENAAGEAAPVEENAADPPPASGPSRRRKLRWALILLALQATVATWGQFDFSNMMGYYDLFADGLVRGYLHIGYTPDQVNLVDMIPYEGRYYLQWGPFPVVFHLLARPLGFVLSDRLACLLAGWLTALVFLEILLVLRRRHFPELPLALCRWFFFAFALAAPAALVTYRGTVYNESIAIALLAVLLGFLALLRYQESPAARWMLLCGACIAAAMTTRVTMALYGAVFFAAVALTLWLAKKSMKTALLHVGLFAAPVVLGVVVMLSYNHARFGSPFDYGNRYKPGESSHLAAFSVLRIPENLRHYLLALPGVSTDFPWIEHVGWPPLEHTSRAEAMSSLLLASPFLLLALLSQRALSPKSGAPVDLKIATAAAAAGGGAMFAVMLLFSAASRRYAHDFVPMFLILAFVGAAMRADPAALWKRLRVAAWCVLAFGALLHAQIAFYQSFHTPTPDANVMRTFVALNPLVRSVFDGPRAAEEEAIARNDLGTVHLREGRVEEALLHFEEAARLLPDSGRIQENLELTRRRAQRR
jgi:hypothetical protein